MNRWTAPALATLLLALATVPVSGQDPRDAWLDLLDEGRVEEGREQLVAYAGGLPPVEATKLLRWIEAISLTEDEDQKTVARALVLTQRDQAEEAVDLLEGHADDRTDDPAALLLAVAARTADVAGDEARASALRVRIIEGFPAHPVVPEAVLELARYRLDQGVLWPETATLLESLIVEQPTHPLVPTARRLLARFQEVSR